MEAVEAAFEEQEVSRDYTESEQDIMHLKHQNQSWKSHDEPTPAPVKTPQTRKAKAVNKKRKSA
jgi:hypothetical protein